VEVEPDEILDDDLDLSLDTIVPTEGESGAEVVRSPLFSDFSQGELLAVMGGLDLLSYDTGDVIIIEGEPGHSLFVLTTGRVKAFVRSPAGRHMLVREMGEGEFFGEIGVLKGGARTATVTAACRVELLELDKKALDGITATHPRVRDVLEAFSRERAGSLPEVLVRGGLGSTSTT
jgi:CRP-like cAMP-binding protein